MNDDDPTQPIYGAGSEGEPAQAGTPPDAPAPAPAPADANVPPAQHGQVGAPPPGAAPPPPHRQSVLPAALGASTGAAAGYGPPEEYAGAPAGYGPPATYAGAAAGYGSPPARRYPAPIGWVIAAIIIFWPTAIPAVLASHRAAAAGGAGDVVTADREAATAKRWSIVSVCVGGALIVLSILFSILWVILAATAFHNDRGGFFFDQRPGQGQHMQVNPHGRGQLNPGNRMPYGPRGGMPVQPTPSPSPTTTP